MEVTRKNGDIQVSLDSKDEAVGLFAVLTNQQGLVTPEQFQKGQLLYQHFFHNVEVLATYWEAEQAQPHRDSKKRKGSL